MLYISTEEQTWNYQVYDNCSEVTHIWVFRRLERFWVGVCYVRACDSGSTSANLPTSLRSCLLFFNLFFGPWCDKVPSCVRNTTKSRIAREVRNTRPSANKAPKTPNLRIFLRISWLELAVSHCHRHRLPSGFSLWNYLAASGEGTKTRGYEVRNQRKRFSLRGRETHSRNLKLNWFGCVKLTAAPFTSSEYENSGKFLSLLSSSVSVKRKLPLFSALWGQFTEPFGWNGLAVSMFHVWAASERVRNSCPFVKLHPLKPFLSWTCPLLAPKFSTFVNCACSEGYCSCAVRILSNLASKVLSSASFWGLTTNRAVFRIANFPSKCDQIVERGPEMGQILKKRKKIVCEKLKIELSNTPMRWKIRKFGAFYVQNGESGENANRRPATPRPPQKNAHVFTGHLKPTALCKTYCSSWSIFQRCTVPDMLMLAWKSALLADRGLNDRCYGEPIIVWLVALFDVFTTETGTIFRIFRYPFRFRFFLNFNFRSADSHCGHQSLMFFFLWFTFFPLIPIICLSQCHFRSIATVASSVSTRSVPWKKSCVEQ